MCMNLHILVVCVRICMSYRCVKFRVCTNRKAKGESGAGRESTNRWNVETSSWCNIPE